MITKAQAYANWKHCEKQQWVLQLALQSVANGEDPDARESMRVDGERMTMTVYRIDAAHGGLVVIKQAGRIDAHYWEDFQAMYREPRSEIMWEVARLIERVRLALPVERDHMDAAATLSEATGLSRGQVLGRLNTNAA